MTTIACIALALAALRCAFWSISHSECLWSRAGCCVALIAFGAISAAFNLGNGIPVALSGILALGAGGNFAYTAHKKKLKEDGVETAKADKEVSAIASELVKVRRTSQD